MRPQCTVLPKNVVSMKNLKMIKARRCAGRKVPFYQQSPFYKVFLEVEKKIINEIKSRVLNNDVKLSKNEFHNKKITQFIPL